MKSASLLIYITKNIGMFELFVTFIYTTVLGFIKYHPFNFKNI